MSDRSLYDGRKLMSKTAAVRNHILIVDDEPPNQLILQDLLEPQFTVHTTFNGRQALDYLKAGSQVDLILMDIMMPEVDGFEACQRIKSEPDL